MRQIGSFHSAQWGAVFVMRATYGRADGPVAIVLESDNGEPLTKLSVNMPGQSEKLPPGCFYVKTWAENETLSVEAQKSGLFNVRNDIPRARSGMMIAPVWEIAY